jgi:Arc/MetJ-type ribon-helix-helix transcriptional regulator
MKKDKEEEKAVFLPAELYSKVEERVKATDFGSVDEYVEFVLEEVVKEEEEEKAFSEEEEKEVKKRLKDLGYLD